MKKLLVLSSIGMVISVSLLLWCCDGSDSSEDIPQTEADRFVASAEYQRLARENQNFVISIRQALSVMSPEDKERVGEICAEIQQNKGLDQVISLTQELQLLTGIDYIGHTYKVRELSEGLFENRHFTSEEFVKALRKYDFLNGIVLQTRTSEPTISVTKPDSTANNAALQEACVQGCYTSYKLQENTCAELFKDKPEYIIICEMERNARLTACIEDCERKFPVTTKPVEPSEPSGPAQPTEPVEPPTEPTEPEKPVAPTNPSTTMRVGHKIPFIR